MNVPQTKSYPTASIARVAAAALIEASLVEAAKIGLDVAVAVTDGAGYLVAFERTDGARFLSAEVAFDKAWTAASFGIPIHVWNAYITGDPKVAQLAHRPRLVAVGGGYPINDLEKLIGGIGVSGGTYQQDQDIAEAALRALGFELPA